MITIDQNFNEDMIASAVKFLMEGQEIEAAKLLLFCSLSIRYEKKYPDSPDYIRDSYYVTVEAPRKPYDALENYEFDRNGIAMRNAIEAVLPSEEDRIPEVKLVIRASRIKVTSDWRKEFFDSIEKFAISNQGIPFQGKPFAVWERLRFRSQSELTIAVALEKAGVLFFPNCIARLTDGQKRVNKEPDFLVLYKGRWGILEVDGEAYHPSAAQDHERDRVFRKYPGIAIVERFPATRCFENPDQVVKEFLELLGKSS